MTIKQDPPFAVQVELCEGCNLYCGFCGLQGIREKKEKNYKFMEEATLRSLMRQITELRWNPRIEFAMHGEPTQHPDFVGMVRVAREEAPRLHLMMTSNASGLMRKPGPLANVLDLFEAGINVLALDDYDGVNFVDRVRNAVNQMLDEEAARDTEEFARWLALSAAVYEYPRQPEGNPHSRRRHTEHDLTLIQDISKAAVGTHSLLNNHAGAGSPPNESAAGKPCAKPFRELSVRHDGNVAVSCNDWRGVYKCGNVVRDGLDAVWNGPAFYAARQKLVIGQRDFGPCKGCDAISYRVGLLPDKFGKQKLPLPDKNTEREIARAIAGGPYTAPVLRPWEVK